MSPRFLTGVRKVSEVILKSEQRWRIHLLIARKLIDREQLELAEVSMNRLRVAVQRYPEALLPLVRQLRRMGRRDEGLDLTDRFWETRAPQSARYALACAKVWYDNSLLWRGDIALAQAKALDPGWLPTHVEEAMNQRWRGNVSIAIDAAERVIALAGDDSALHDWTVFIADEHFKVERFAEAAASYETVALGRLAWWQKHRYALSLERLGREREAARVYSNVEQELELSGIAARAHLHLRAGYPLKSLQSVGDRTDIDSHRVRIRALMMLARFAEAAVVAEQSDDHELVELRALALELDGRASEAVDLYPELLKKDMEPADRARLLLRFSRVACDADQAEEAVQAAIEASPDELLEDLDDEVHPSFDSYVKELRWALQRGELESAGLVSRLLAFSASTPGNFRRLRRLYGHYLVLSGDIAAAAREVRSAVPYLLPNAREVDGRKPLTRGEAYSEALEALAIRPRTILYESFHGAKTACNPLALCLRLLEEDSQSEWQHVWAIEDGAAIHPELLGRENVHFVRIGSYGYRIHLATASHLVNNTSFPRWFLRREGQRYLNTWHGVPWKRMGSDVADDPYSFDNISRNLLHATELAFPDEHTAKVLVETQDLGDMLARKPLTLGYPRVDLTLNLSDERAAAVRARVGVSGERLAILYAPTWRGVVGSVESATEPFVEAIGEMAKRDVDVIVRVHHFIASGLNDAGLPPNVYIAPEDVDTNELLGIISILVSDYSSLIFDFAARSLPILKYVYDLESYSNARGLYFDVAEVPGRSCRSLDDLGTALDEIVELDTLSTDWSQLPTAGCWANEDGNASDRVLERFLGPLPKPERLLPSQILVSVGGFNPNGITRSLRNLVATYPADEAKLRLFLPRQVLDDPVARPVGEELHQRIDFTLHTGLHTGTRQERLAWERLSKIEEFVPASLDKLIRHRLQREKRLYFADVEFDTVVDFDGYNLNQVALIGMGFPRETRSIYMLHSDFCQEVQIKYPRHRRIAAIFRNYDVLCSVSESAYEANRTGLEAMFGVPRELHRELPNTIDVTGIYDQARKPLDADLEDWFARPGPHAIMVGRLSVEKNHAAVLEALSSLHESGGELDLLILGDGPRHQELRQQVERLGLEESVKFAGLRVNPYPAIQRADALVLASLIEGQGLVLLEAMTLGTPVASTDIPGPASVLEGGRYGLLVSPDVGGILSALEAVAQGELSVADFDPVAYQQAAVEAFVKVAAAA